MLIDIQRSYNVEQSQACPQNRNPRIPYNYVVSNNELKILGKGFIQRLIDKYEKKEYKNGI